MMSLFEHFSLTTNSNALHGKRVKKFLITSVHELLPVR